MLRYLPGIILVQVVTFALFWVNKGAPIELLLLRAGLPAILFSVVTALWLSMIGRFEAERRNSALREQFSDERAQLNREIERTRSDAMQEASLDRAQILERANTERERLVRQTHKQLMKQERGASRRANIKVGLAFMGLTGFGVLMLVTQFMTLGLLTITAAGGAMGGYLFRWRQSRHMLDRLATLPSNSSNLPVLENIGGATEIDPATKELPPVDIEDAVVVETGSDSKNG